MAYFLSGAPNRKRGASFEAEHLVGSFVDHVRKPVGAGFVDMLREFIDDAHKWKATHGDFPTPKEVSRIVGVRKTTVFEESMAQLVKDMASFFSSKPPREIVGRVFRALKNRWGFDKTNRVSRLAAAAEGGGVSIEALIAAEADLVRRLGWLVDSSRKERIRWTRL